MSHPDDTSGRLQLDTLTFGIELEFIAITPVDQMAPHNYIARELGKPVQISCDNPACGTGRHTYRLPIVDHDTRELLDSYEVWDVKSDSSIHLHRTEQRLWNPDEYNMSTVEIVSRVMRFDRADTDSHAQACTFSALSWDWRREVAVVLDTLHKAFDKPGYRLFTNFSTGLHVHLGNNGAEVPLDMAQGIMAMFTAFERQIDTVIPTTRISSYDGGFPLPGLDPDSYSWLHELAPKDNTSEPTDLSSFALSPSNAMFSSMAAKPAKNLLRIEKSGSVLTHIEPARLHKAFTSVNVPSWLAYIKEAEVIDDLHIHTGWSGGHSSAINLDNTDSVRNRQPGHVPDVKQTIEVRLHSGSLDADEISAWVDFLGNLAHFVTRSDPFPFISKAWSEDKFAFPDLVKAVGVSTNTVRYYSDRVSADWPKRRHDRLINQAQKDGLVALTRQVEKNRLRDFDHIIIQDKIKYKILTGSYGQLPRCVLQKHVDANTLRTKRGKWICIKDPRWQQDMADHVAVFRRWLENNATLFVEWNTSAADHWERTISGGVYPPYNSPDLRPDNASEIIENTWPGKFSTNLPNDHSSESDDIMDYLNDRFGTLTLGSDSPSNEEDASSLHPSLTSSQIFNTGPVIPGEREQNENYCAVVRQIRNIGEEGTTFEWHEYVSAITAIGNLQNTPLSRHY